MSTLSLSKIKKIGCLSKGEQVLLDDIVFLSQQEGYCWASVSKLSERNEISERSVKRYVRKLVDLGLLTEKFIYGKNASHIIGRTLTVVTHKVWDLINFYTEQAKKKHEEKKNKYSMSAYVQKQREQKQQSAATTPTPVPTKSNDEEVKPQQTPVNQDEVNVSDEVRAALKEKLNLNADKVIEKLEKQKGTYEVVACINHVYKETVVKKQQSVGSTNYLLSTFKNGFSGKCGGHRVVREEIKPDYVDTNTQAWDEYYAKQKQQAEEKRKSSTETMDEKIERLNLYNKIPFGTPTPKPVYECSLEELREIVSSLGNNGGTR